MRRIRSTTFIPCIHGEIRFLRSKKNKNRKRIENNSEESVLGIESHRLQNQELESDSIPKMSESNSPSCYDSSGLLRVPSVLLVCG